jgi:peptidoglycan/LPS O-acetylase OafA/YrhL
MPPPTTAGSTGTSPTVAAPTGSRGRVAALDGLRGLAIVAVVLFHVAVMATRDAPWIGNASPPVVLWPLFAGKLGVDVFFVLSGFLCMQSWHQLRSRHAASRSIREFTKRRARRIIPPYWFSLLLLVPLRAPEWLTTWNGWWNILTFASVQQFMDPQLPHHVNVVTWSLTTEVHFYVLLPLLAVVLRRLGWAKLVIGMIGLSVLWRFANGGTGTEAEWIVGRIDQFVAGMAAASLVTGAPRSALVRTLLHRRTGWILAAAATAVAVPLGATQLLRKPLAFEATFHAAFGLVAAAWLVRLVLSGRPSRLELPWLGTIGAVSYSLYLWHWPLMMEASIRWGPSAVVLTGALAASVVMTWISYVLLERPFTRPSSRGPGRSDTETAVTTRDGEPSPAVPLASTRR